MKKLSTIAALAIASLVAANVHAADQKGMSGMQGMEGRRSNSLGANGACRVPAPFLDLQSAE
jgi:hypothetical protein